MCLLFLDQLCLKSYIGGTFIPFQPVLFFSLFHLSVLCNYFAVYISIILHLSLFFFPFYFVYLILSSKCIVYSLYFYIFLLYCFVNVFKIILPCIMFLLRVLHFISYFSLLLKLIKCQATDIREEAVYSYKQEIKHSLTGS